MSLAKLRNKINMVFPDETMEAEYTKIKKLNVQKDFQITTICLIILNILVFVPGIAREGDNYPEIGIGSGLVLLCIILFLLQNKCKAYLEYFTILLLLAFNVSRLVMMKINYNTNSKISLFFQGYVYASIQCIIVSRLRRVDQKIIVVILCFALRLAFIYGAIVPSAFSGYTLARQTCIDCFMIYIFCTSEKSERRVFQNFWENQEELLKFKELLDDSLPQSITVLDCLTFAQLFANKTFLKIFDNKQLDSNASESNLNPITENLENLKLNINSLVVDSMTLREIGSIQISQPAISLSQNVYYLRELLERLVQENILNGKTLSVSAYHVNQDKRRSFEITIKKVKWDRINAVAIIFNDITYQENLIALKAANLNKDRIIATVSHELRTPLHGIIGILEITETKVNDSSVLENLSLCEDNAHLLLSLVNSILDLHQISTGKLSLNISRIDLRKALKEVVRLFQFQCNEKKIYLDLTVGQEVPNHIITDENRLKQIIINLVGNAIKFTLAGGIKIEVVQDPQENESLLFSVTDTGIGIKKEDQGRLFKMEGVLEEGESVNKHGVGLGLTISNALASMLKGNKSEEQGLEFSSVYQVGSRFYFRIKKELGNIPHSQLTIARNDSLDLREKRDNIEENQPTSLARAIKPILTQRYDSQAQLKGKDEESISSTYLEELLVPLDLDQKLASYVSLKNTNALQSKSLSKIFNNRPTIKEGSLESDGANCDVQPGVLMSQLREIPHKELSSEEEKSNQSPKKSEKSPDTDKGFILVVDDNPFNLLVASNLIVNLGYSVKLAREGQQAIEIAKTMQKDGENLKVIFMDCQMPIMDGYETTRALIELMQESKVQRAPILAWTANNSKEDVQRCYDCGMQGHLSKPTTQETLIKVLSDLK